MFPFARVLAAGFLALSVTASALLVDVAAAGPQAPAPSLASVTVAPESVLLAPGGSAPLSVEVRNKRGKVVAKPKVAWASSDVSVATVSSSGVVTAVGEGSATVTATSSGLQDTATVTVDNPDVTDPVIELVSPAVNQIFEAGDLIVFAATASDDQDGNLTNDIIWSLAGRADPGAESPLGSGGAVSSSEIPVGEWLAYLRVVDSAGNDVAYAVAFDVVAGPCAVTAVLDPGDGEYGPGNLALDATGSTDSCGRELRYFWGCGPAGEPECSTFVTTANGNGNTRPQATLYLEDNDLFGIVLDVCAAGTADCDRVERTYGGSAACQVTADLDPDSGLRVAQNLPLSAAGSSDSCGRDLQYFWGCTSTTSLACPDFLAAANSAGNSQDAVALPIRESDEFDITLTVCAAGTDDCAAQLQRTFYGAPDSAG